MNIGTYSDVWCLTNVMKYVANSSSEQPFPRLYKVTNLKCVFIKFKQKKKKQRQNLQD